MRRSTALIRLAFALLMLAAITQAPSAQSSECTEGSFKTVVVGPMCSCEDGMRTPKERYQCIDGQWEYLYSFCGGPFCQGDPGGGGGGCSSSTPGSCDIQPGQACPAQCYCCY